MRCLQLPLLFGAAAGQFVFEHAAWLTEHHDTRNSGQSDEAGPAERNGTCVHDLVWGNADDPNGARYYATGVLSTTNEYMYVGNSLNQLQVIEVESFVVTAINLTLLGPNTPASTWGVVASPTTHQVLIDNGFGPMPYDRLYISSADGNLYALHVGVCTGQQAYDRSAALLVQSPTDPAVRTVDMAAARARHGAEYATEAALWDAVNCIAWIRTFPQPLYAPPRWVPASPSYPNIGDGVVLASQTAEASDSGGILHGVDAVTGNELWQFPAWYIDGVGANVTAGLRVVPAVAPNVTLGGLGLRQTYVGFLGFGTRLVAFDSYTGIILAEANSSYIVEGGDILGGTDVFVSSPTLTADYGSLFMHASQGTLWKVAVGGLSFFPATNLTLTWAWACDYFITGATHVCDKIEDIIVHGGGAALPATNRVAQRALVLQREGLPVPPAGDAGSDYVNGGFYQPTTRAQRDELFAAAAAALAALPAEALPEDAVTRALHSRLLRAAAEAEEQGPGSAPLPPLSIEEGALALRALPFETVARLRTPSGYALWGANGRPVADKLDADAARDASSSSSSLVSVAVAPAAASAALWHGRRQAAAARAPAAGVGLGYGGVFPFATPSLMIHDNAVIIAQYASFGADSGVFSIDAASGEQNWCLQNVTGKDGLVVRFGRSRSSPAIDTDGSIYVATDSDEFIYTLPLLMAISPHGIYNWAVVLDVENVIVGAASPIVGQGFLAERRAYMVSGVGVSAVDEGYECPGELDPFTPCSGHGVCACQTGECICADNCWKGTDCSVQQTCSGHGVCNGMTGCKCDACFTGPDCSAVKDCGAHGVCNGNGTCTCSDCYSGPNCDVPLDCGAHGTCDTGSGGCVCTDCYSGPTCNISLDCGAHGTCDAGTGTCTCSDCYSGPTCSVAVDCGPHGSCSVDTGGVCKCDACWDGLTCDAPLSCNGHGMCNAGTGVCDCDLCSTGDTCELVNDCYGHGTCAPSTGVCTCSGPYYDPATFCSTCDKCHSGPASGCSTVSQTCSGHGTCDPAAGSCACTGGYTGATCAQAPAAAGDAGGVSPGVVAAGVLVPTLLLGAAGFLVWWRVKNPLRPLSDLMPSFGKGSAGKYTSLMTKPAGSGAAGSGASLARAGTLYTTSSGGAAAASVTELNASRIKAKGSGGGGYGSYQS